MPASAKNSPVLATNSPVVAQPVARSMVNMSRMPVRLIAFIFFRSLLKKGAPMVPAGRLKLGQLLPDSSANLLVHYARGASATGNRGQAPITRLFLRDDCHAARSSHALRGVEDLQLHVLILLRRVQRF